VFRLGIVFVLFWGGLKEEFCGEVKSGFFKGFDLGREKMEG